jgi:hypothetical protein
MKCVLLICNSFWLVSTCHLSYSLSMYPQDLCKGIRYSGTEM